MGYNFVMIRHGESVWNKENLFTGWTDVDLSKACAAEAVLELNIPTGVPLLYELGEYLQPLKHYYLRDERINKKIDAVKTRALKAK